MRITLKPIAEQTLVITGASSGIGLATARAAVRDGARVFLTSRNASALARIVEELDAVAGEPRAAYRTGDVADPDAMVDVAEAAVARFGGIDTWVNNAGVSLYGRLTDLPLKDKRRVFDVDFWGTVHGCRAAVPRLRDRGGAIVNVGSVVGKRAVPLQGIYSAAKHATKGYTDALRVELAKDGLPISVTLVKPSSINTPFFEHARTRLGVEPAPPPPVYQPEVVAEAILYCAEHPVRQVTVGASGILGAFGSAAPRLADAFMTRTMFRLQRTDRPVAPGRRDNLYEPGEDGRAHGLYEGPVLERSAVTRTALGRRRVASAVGLGVLALAAMTLLGDGE